MEKLSGYLPEGSAPLFVPHENFNRAIGITKRSRHFTNGEEFTGTDEEWDNYLASVLPSDKDEEDLKELFKLAWVAEKKLSERQISSGIGGATA